MRRSLFVLVPVLLVAIIVLVAVDRAPSFLRPRLEAAITRTSRSAGAEVRPWRSAT
jgi:hypothetical protein